MQKVNVMYGFHLPVYLYTIRNSETDKQGRFASVVINEIQEACVPSLDTCGLSGTLC